MAEYTTYRLPPPEGHYHQNYDPLSRSGTHNSHYSHASHATTTTESWVQQTAQYPPPPPIEDEALEQSMSPARTPRPLPQPQLRPQTFHTVNVTEPPPVGEFDDEEYMDIGPDVSGHYEFQQRRRMFAGPSRRVEPPPPEPFHHPPQPAKQGSFVGGFVRGLRKLPKKMMGYGVSNEKARLFRRGTLGTEASGGTDTGMTTGNTLPLYRSNPSSPAPGPSNVQYVQDFRMAFPPNNHPIPEVTRIASEEPVPQSLLPGGALLRRNTPTFRITPPSDSTSHESHAQIFQSPQPHYVEVVHPDVQAANNAERTTVMVYGESVDASMPVAEPGLQRTSSRMPRASVVPTPARAPSITIQAPLARPPSAPEPPQPVVEEVADLVQSPATEDPLPAPDYRKMPHFPGSPSRRTFMTATGTSWYDPSFTPDLTPVERFFKTLYHLPWVSHGRVTIDYRPGAGFQGKDKAKALVKKPMASWYRRFSRSSKSAELDLLSNGTQEITPRTSLGTSMVSSMASPRSLRTKRSMGTSDSRNHHSSGHRRRRRHRNRRRSMSTIEEPERGGSPIIPGVYPYPYPAYPYTYPGYAAVPPALPYPPGMSPPMSPTGSPQHNTTPNPHTPIQMQMAAMPMAPPVPVQHQHQPQQQAQHQHSSRHHESSGSKRGPRGPRSRSTRKPTYPNGYAPYQAMSYPPIYMAPPPGTPGQMVGGANGATPPHGHYMMQPMFTQMHVPGAYPVQDVVNSTTTSIPSPPSSPTPRAASTAPQQPAA
ncbi:hypothetical protein MD484_g3729, partial [Candolleomyces efflorescens]